MSIIQEYEHELTGIRMYAGICSKFNKDCPSKSALCKL